MRLMKQIWMQFSGKLCGKGRRGKAHETGTGLGEQKNPTAPEKAFWGGENSCMSICRY